MNKAMIIGNLTRDPELRSTSNGTPVCTFTVAVNRRKSAEAGPEADFFRVTAWRQLGENCNRYLAKGRKVPRGGWHSLYLELKRRKGGTLSANQRIWLNALSEQGHLAVCCKGADEAIRTIERYLKCK